MLIFMVIGVFISVLLVFIAGSALMLIIAPITILVAAVLWIKGWVKW